MMRRILRWRPEPDDGAEEYMSITSALLNKYRDKYEFRRWDAEALGKVFDWAGHVARFSKWAPNRLAYKILQYRGIRYLNTLQRMYGSQCHGKKFKVWRYEQQFTRVFGADWQTVALNSETWADLKWEWLTGRKAYAKF